MDLTYSQNYILKVTTSSENYLFTNIAGILENAENSLPSPIIKIGNYDKNSDGKVDEIKGSLNFILPSKEIQSIDLFLFYKAELDVKKHLYLH